MGRPTKENSLSRQDVINAAIACVEKEGEAALGVNRVARELGIKPPAIYKHLQGNAELKKAVAVAVYQLYFDYIKRKTTEVDRTKNLLKAGGLATREFAKLHPRLYQIMVQFQLQPDDSESASIIKESQNMFQMLLDSQDLSTNKSIDIMRMVNSAIIGFINLEQSKLLTLPRSTDDSFEVMLDALLKAIEYIKMLDDN